MIARSRLIIELELALQSAYHSTGDEPSFATDRALARNNKHEIELSAFGLIGSLRTELTRLLEGAKVSVGDLTVGGAEAIDHLFGMAIDDEHGDQRGNASRLSVIEICRLGASPWESSVEDGVAIHRGYGAARDKLKYDVEVALPGERYRVLLELDLDPRATTPVGTGSVAESVLALGLRTWAAASDTGNWLATPTIGARAGVGLGSLAVRLVDVRRVDLTDRTTLAAWLTRRTGSVVRRTGDGCLMGTPSALPDWETLRSSIVRAVGPNAEATDSWPGTLSVALDLHADSLLVGGSDEPPRANDQNSPKSPRDSDARSLRRPRPTPDDQHGSEHPLRGSAVRGPVRSHAERIVRFLGRGSGYAACDPLETDKNSPWLACDRCIREEDRLSGHAGRSENDAPIHRGLKERGSAEHLRGRSCPVCALFGNTRLGGRVVFREARIDHEGESLIDRVAIDRFTSGSQDRLKFDMAPLLAAKACSMVSLDRPTGWDSALLLLALRDLADGWLSVGSRTTNGLGWLSGSVSAAEWRRFQGDVIADALPEGVGPWKRWTTGATPRFLGETTDFELLPEELRAFLAKGLARLTEMATNHQLLVEKRLQGAGGAS